jgi:diguanylate cyclase (GGDEF)-like protein
VTSAATAQPSTSAPISALLLDRIGDPRVRAFRDRLIQHRLRRLCVVLAVLVLAWIGLEAPALPAAQFVLIAGLRTALAVVLLLIALAAPRWPPLLGLFALILAQVLLFAAMRTVACQVAPGWLQLGYGMLPFVLVAQLALFPLPLLRSALLALPVVALTLMPLWHPASVSLHSPAGDLWLLALILALSAWAAAAQLGLLLELLSARWEATHDALSGLVNRRYALDLLERAIAASRRSGQPLALLLLDLDRFKRINDEHGHAIGDAVIRCTGDVLQAAVRENEVAARVGGEEFAVVLPATGVDAARQAAERIRQRIESARVALPDGREVAVTTSIGLSMLQPGDRPESLLARADAALYRAKNLGRNRVELAPEAAAG